MKKNILFAKIIFVLFLLSGCASQEIKSLDSVEVKNYEGKKLSSIEDFRENSIKGPQYIDINDYKLQVTGLVKNPKNYTYEEVISRQTYEKIVTLHCVEGWEATILWEGILLKDLLAETEPKLRANTIIFYAYDGYSTAFPMEYIMENNIILAHKMNNATMIPERGFPFQLVAESKWGYKWIKWITKIEFSNDKDYEGYWESRGYSNTGDLDEGFFK